MIRHEAEAPPQPRPEPTPCQLSARETRNSEPRTGYGPPFWCAFLSNLTIMMAVALLYRYADFIQLLGGTEFHLGWIVGVGIAGSVATRLLIGSWIDRFGSRPLWIGSLLLFAVTCLAHLAVTTYNGPMVYLLHILFYSSVAGINGAAVTFVSHCGPEKKIAEMIGMWGTSGFIGAVLGTQLGDLLFSGAAGIARLEIVEMFVSAAALSLLAIPLAWTATRGEKHAALLPWLRKITREWLSRRVAPASCLCDEEEADNSRDRLATCPTGQPSMWAILRRHNPGVVLAVGVAMGIGLGLPPTFLRPFAAGLGIPRIGVFFLVYSITAVITRVITRQWVERYGTRLVMLVSLAGLGASLLLFLPVDSEWMLIPPAIGIGCFHAVLFPTVLAAGCNLLPARNRGMATLLVLATWDVGRLIGAPLAGGVLRLARLTGLPPYPTMYIAMSLLLGAVCVWYAVGVLFPKRSPAIEREGELELAPAHRPPLPALDERDPAPAAIAPNVQAG